MHYTIKAIPTTYAGVNFRSRLEARWAAFFDLCGWKWDYEPFDLDGWAPDFLLRAELCDLLVEVKPVDMSNAGLALPDGPFAKAVRHWKAHQILLLGLCPSTHDYLGAGYIMDPPQGATHSWADVFLALSAIDLTDKWREAGNLVQWKSDNDDFDIQMRRIFRRRAA